MITMKIKLPRRAAKTKGKKRQRTEWEWVPRFHPLTGEDRYPERVIVPMTKVNSLGGLCGFMPGACRRGKRPISQTT